MNKDQLREALNQFSVEEILEILIDELQVSVDQNDAFAKTPELIRKLLGLIYWWNPNYFKENNRQA